MTPEDLSAWLRLSLTPGVGNETARKLLRAFGSPPGVFEQTTSALKQVVSTRLADAIQTIPEELNAQVQLTQSWLQDGANRHLVTLGDAAYPAGLLDIEDPPLMLYMLGSIVNNGDEAIKQIASGLAIVGSRNPTPQGRVHAQQFARVLSQAGLCVVSGLALGVDAAAHEGALQGGGCTIAVVGTGLDRVYPRQHLELAHRIAQQGLIVSEFALGTPPIAANFPKRNRIISGLSLGTLVVEAALQSGSLITARLAAEQGKEVFAIPGSIDSPQSRGCHALIKQGAKLVETAQDVLEELHFSSGTAPQSVQQEQPEPCVPDSPLLSAMGYDLVDLDTLQNRTGLDTPQLQAQLLELELGGQIARLPGGSFQRIRLS